MLWFQSYNFTRMQLLGYFSNYKKQFLPKHLTFSQNIMTLLSESYSIHITLSAALTLSNIWLLQDRQRPKLPSVAPGYAIFHCYILMIIAASNAQSWSYFLLKHVELLKDLSHICLHYLKKLLGVFFSVAVTQKYSMQCFFKKMGKNTLCPRAFVKSHYCVI